MKLKQMTESIAFKPNARGVALKWHSRFRGLLDTGKGLRLGMT
jgi:hypothetical protein